MKAFAGSIFPVIILMMHFHARATVFYVSPGGSDLNKGTTIYTAWRTIAKINSTNFKGDTILFQGGMTFMGGLSFTESDIGSTSRPIVIGSYGKGRAIISSDSLDFGFFAYNSAGYKISNLIFRGPGRTRSDRSGIIFYMDADSTVLSLIHIAFVEVSGFKYSGISVGSWNGKSGYRDISIRNCVVHDNGLEGISTYAQAPYVHSNVYISFNKVYNNTGIADKITSNSGNGIVLGGVNGASIQYCSVYNNGALHSNSNGGPVGIWAYESNRVIIQYNESHHNKTKTSQDGGGFDLDGGCTNSIMQYNYSHDNYGPGYMIAEYEGAPVSRDNIIRYNISENDVRKNDYGAIHIWSYSSSINNIRGAEIYNNTVYISSVNSATPRAFHVKGGGMSGVNVRNNIFQTTGPIEMIRVANPAGIVMLGNNYWSSGSPFLLFWGGATYRSLTDWRAGSGQEKLYGKPVGYQSDPLFYDSTKGITYDGAKKVAELPGYRLSAYSNLLNKGLDLKTLFGINPGSHDFWGNSILNKTSFNVGAYQGPSLNSLPMSAMEESGSDVTEKAGIRLYPNPLTSNSLLDFSLPLSGLTRVDLLTIDGKILKTFFNADVHALTPGQIRIDGSGLARGIYIVSVTNKGKVIFEKGVIKL